MSLLQIKLTLAAFCLMAVGASQLYLKGVDDGIANIDREAFDSYVHFAKQMKSETHKPHRDYAQAQSSVWDAVDSSRGGK